MNKPVLTTANTMLVLPEIADSEIEEIAKLMNVDFSPDDQERRAILKCLDSIDIQAIPGSGKTTLLVAKLALLANKWPHLRKGFCILSHTNVARVEIERRLSNSSLGHKLLSYPHYIGTIHGFVNEFIAIPWMRSIGLRIEYIDNTVCGERCRSFLYRTEKYRGTRYALSQREKMSPEKDSLIRSLFWSGANRKLASAVSKDKRVPFAEKTQTFEHLLEIKERVSLDGYYMHEDMFSFALQAIEKNPSLILFLRGRFEVIIIDEMQDTSEMQLALLHKLFPVDPSRLRQRFGDTNQTIFDDRTSLYNSDTEERDEERHSDAFPMAEQDRQRPLTTSLRFSQWVADRIAPFAVVPQNLIGRSKAADAPHTIFVFSANRAKDLLPAYADLILDVFNDEEIAHSDFRALARTQISKADEQHSPRCIHDYWSEYNHRVIRQSPTLHSFIEYVRWAQRQRLLLKDCAVPVRIVTNALTRLVSIALHNVLSWRPSVSASLKEKLSSDTAAQKIHNTLVWKWCVRCDTISEETWKEDVSLLKKMLSKVCPDLMLGSPDVTEFLRWKIADSITAASDAEAVSGSRQVIGENVFRHRKSGRWVDIRLSTIHAAKGETHTSTLIMETYYNGFDIAETLPWFLGINNGPYMTKINRKGLPKSKSVGKLQMERLRLLYVGMSRPSKLLCLAVRQSSLGNTESEVAATADILSKIGWRITSII